MYNDKSKWNTLLDTEESKTIAKLLGADQAKILRIGNDTSDESEISHMDGILLNSRILITSASTNEEDSEFILAVNKHGQKFLREMNGDIIAYYIINDEGTPDWALRDFGFRGELTPELLEKMEPGTIIAKGEIKNSDSEDGLFMVNSNIGKKLLWVAKRGGAPDWAIYTHWAENGLDYVLTQGEKVSKYNVRKLVACTDEALKMYRS